MLKNLLNKYKNSSSIAKAAFWYTFCNFLNKGISLLATPIFTRIMTEEQYGTFAIFQSWFNILIIFTSLNIFLAGYTKGLLKYKDDKNNFTSSQLALTSFGAIIFLIIYGLNIGFWENFFKLPSILMVAMFAELLVMPAYEFWMARKRYDYKYKSVVLVTLLMNISCIILSVIAVLCAEDKLTARTFSDAGIKVLFGLPIFALILLRGKKFINLSYWKYALNFNIPLIPHYLSNYILNQSDRIMIGKMVGNVQAGYYSVSYTIATVMLLLTTSLSHALTPYIYKSINNNDNSRMKNIKRRTTPLFLLVAVSCLALSLFAPEIVKFFAGEKYMEAIYVIPPVAASVYFIFAYNMFSNIEYYYSKTKKIALATTISAIANIILNYICIKTFGYIAAGYTTLVCYILLCVLHYIFYRKLIKQNLSKFKDLYSSKTIFALGLLLITLSILISLVYNNMLIRYAIIIIIAIICILFRKSIIKALKVKEENV